MEAVAIICRFLCDNCAERVANVVAELFKGSLGAHAAELKNMFADMDATGNCMDEEEKLFYFLESLCPFLENVKTLLKQTSKILRSNRVCTSFRSTSTARNSNYNQKRFFYMKESGSH